MKTTDSICLICRKPFEWRVPRARCQRCDAPFHYECAEYNEGRCAIYGCLGRLTWGYSKLTRAREENR